jgi:HSP20 family protein
LVGIRQRDRDEERDRHPYDPFADWGFGDIFEQFDEHFRRMQHFMNRSIREAIEHGAIEGERGKPYIYGWSLRIGPDGKPQFHEFGNMPTRPGMSQDAREPLVDVVDRGDSVTVTAEMPGVDKEHIDLEVQNTALVISVESDSRRYYKEIELPAEVDFDSARASYKNGILDIEFDKRENPKKGRKINIG